MSAQISMIPIDHISESPFNPRKTFNDATLAELAESIREAGLQQPIKVRPVGAHDAGYLLYEAVFGHRRLRACRLAGLEDVPAIMEEMTDDQVRVAQIAENLHREDVTPLEEAEALQLLRAEHGYTTAQLQKVSGKSRTYVFNRLKLLEASADVRTAIADGRLQADAALPIARLPSHTLQNAVLAQVLEGVTEWRQGERTSRPMSVREVDELVSNKRTPLAGVFFPLWDASLVADAGSCSACRKNSTNCPDLLEEGIEADQCMDKACLDTKAEAHVARLIEPLEAAGAVKWDLIFYQREWALDSGDMVRLEPWRAAYEKKHKLDGVKYWVEDGEVHLAIEKTLLCGRLRAADKKFAAEEKKAREAAGDKGERLFQQQAGRPNYFEQRRKCRQDAQQALLDRVPLRLTASDFNVIAASVLAEYVDMLQVESEVAQAFGFTGEDFSDVPTLLAKCEQTGESAAQMLAITALCELVMEDVSNCEQDHEGLRDHTLAAFNRHGVDLLAIYRKHFPEDHTGDQAGVVHLRKQSELDEEETEA
jgi:ParB/RepB/Spo0J family partition protein